MALIIEEKVIESLPITVDPEIVSGTPVFAGTRVPVEALLISVSRDGDGDAGHIVRAHKIGYVTLNGCLLIQPDASRKNAIASRQ